MIRIRGENLSAKWRLASLVGIIVAIVSLIMSYVFPELQSIIQTIIIVITAIVTCGVGYQFFYKETSDNSK